MIELTSDEVRARLSTAVRAAGSQRAFATRAGLSPAFINDVMHGRRTPGARLLAALDLQRIERFVTRGGV